MISAAKRNPSLLFQIVVISIAIVWLYSPILERLVEAWGMDDNYSHGYFIPAVAIYMAFSLRDSLRKLEVNPANSGIPVLVLGLAMLIVAKVGSEYFVQRFSLIVVLLGLVLFLFGKTYCRQLLIPILYLLFMIPLPAIIWNKIAFPLQLFSSYLTEQVVYFMGITVFRQGNVLHLSDTVLEVVAACSGLRSLVTFFALSSAVAFFSGISTPRKWILFFSAAPIAILANVVRLTATALLATRFGSEVAHGFLHEFSGVVVFFLGLVLLVFVNKLLDVKSMGTR